jgi:guanylate kinase
MLLLLTGPSCSGKSTIANELKRSNGFTELKSHTTRPRRYPEEEDYYFVSRIEFERKTYANKVDYAGNLYGLSIEELHKAMADPDGKYLVIVEANGAKQIWDAYRNHIEILKIFIDCDDTALERRLTERGIDVEIRRARWDIDRADKEAFHFIVRNEDLGIEPAVLDILSAVEYWFGTNTIRGASCDGGCQLEKGCWAYAVFGYPVYGEVMPVKATTNNIAEYTGLISLLVRLKTLPASWAREVIIHMDSQLVVSQVNGTFKVKKEHLKPLKERVVSLLRELPFRAKLKWVPREDEWIKMVDKETKRLLN